ncbi:MAG: CBS domain-containing protein [Gemmatimonadales bacterium]|jgi:magnesium transporter
MNASEELSARFTENHPADAARVLERAAPEATAAFLAEIPTPAAALVVRQMNVGHAAAALSNVDVERSAAVIDHLPLSHAALVLRQMGPVKAESLLEKTAEKAARALRRVLRYREGSAGALADPQVLTLPSDIDVADAQKQLRRLAGDVAHNIYVTDRDHRLVGVVTVRELLLARPKQTLASVMKRQPRRLAADSDLASVIASPDWQQLDMLPVVDTTEVFLGAIRHRTIRQLAQTRARAGGLVDILNVALGIADMYWTSLSTLAADVSVVGAAQRQRTEREVAR